MVLTPDAKEILRQARKRLNSSACWTTGAYVTGKSGGDAGKVCYCLAGALFDGPGYTFDKRRNEIERHLLALISRFGHRDHDGHKFDSIEVFNDHQGRTYQQIIEVLESGIATA